MRIQHNIPAMASYRNYSNNVSAVSKNLEKLSSGYKINRAGDDAAGLAISEKMRIQITGLEQAQNNAKSGINLVQTAEGALTEVHDMLNRMYTLAEQSANGTYSDDVDREQLQKEVNSLRTEINRIADATNYNGINLLDGSLEAGKASGGGSATVDLSALKGNMLSGISTVDATKGKYSTAAVLSADATIAAANVGDKYEFTFEYTDNDGNHQKKTVSFEVGLADGKKTSDIAAANTGVLVLKAEDGSTYNIGATASAGNKMKATEVNAALISELSKDADFSANLKVAAGDSTNGAGMLAFTAVNAGADGAALERMTLNTVAKSDGSSKQSTIKVDIGKDVAPSTATGTEGITTAVDSFKTVDLSNAAIWDGIADKLEDAIFEINGQKFVFVNNGITLNDDQKAMLSDAGVGNNYVTTAAADTIAAADVTDMATKIAAATGLKAETGTLTTGDTNTWDSATASTVLALKDNVSVGTGKTSGGLTLQIGDTADDFNKLTVSIKDMHADAMGIGKIDISTQEGASAAMDAIKDATNYVSDVRGDLGALQNRLDHTINNLSVTQQNIQDAESTIRDVDIAKEMMSYTKNNILVQSAQAMLAQANQLPQGVLQLLG